MTSHATQPAAPAFYLYGEPHRTVDAQFVHIEALDDRSRPGGWRIRPHLHTDLGQLLHIADGGGTLTAGDGQLPFAAPCLLVVPAGVVHGFTFTPESRGAVVTLSARHLAGLTGRDAALAVLFGSARALALGEAAALAARLLREHGWAAPGHRAAIDAALLGLLVLALRRSERAAAPPPRSGRQAALVARLRAHVEQHFRRRESVAAMAAALGTGAGTLTAACARVADTSPLAMVDARAMLEAKRALVYANLSVAQVGYALGFGDPAYFSRFFARHAGCSPRAFRDGALR